MDTTNEDGVNDGRSEGMESQACVMELGRLKASLLSRH